MFKKLPYALSWLCLILSLNSAHSADNDNAHLSTLFSEVDKQKLFDDLTWLRLLHFRVNPKVADHSDIISPDFFTAYDKGKHGNETKTITPKEELYATLRAFYQPVGADEDAHPQCRFPTRFYWLNKKLNIPRQNLPSVQCTRLEKWAKFSSLDSVSLIMVSGYFGNPASTFGHLLVKLNNSEYKSSSGDLLDQSINYGAKVPDDEPIPLYIMKGLFGGYVSSFSDKNFYTQDLVYSKNEFRDMWEYELNLSEEKNRLLVYHIWEMMGKQATYYFLKENCGYRIAELLELVTEQNLTPVKQPWYLPLSVFQQLDSIERSRYIKNVTYLPSSQRKLHHNFNQLSNEEAGVVNEILAKFDASKSTAILETMLEDFAIKRRSKMIEVMLEYYQYKLVNGDNSEEKRSLLKQHKDGLILERLKLPIHKGKDSPSMPVLESPVKGAEPRLFYMGVGDNEAQGLVLELGLTAIHFDILTNSKGSLENSELKVFDLSLHYDNKQNLSIKKFDVVSVQKLGLSNTKLLGESNLSWRVRTGFERTDLNCKDCTNFYFKGGVGQALKLSDALIAYGMLDGKYIAENNTLEMTPNIGFVAAFNDRFKSTLEVGTKIDVESGQKDENIKLEARYSFSKNNTIRLSFEKFRGEEIMASFYHHW